MAKAVKTQAPSDCLHERILEQGEIKKLIGAASNGRDRLLERRLMSCKICASVGGRVAPRVGTASGLGIAATEIADSAAGFTVGTASGSAQRSDQSTSQAFSLDGLDDFGCYVFGERLFRCFTASLVVN